MVGMNDLRSDITWNIFSRVHVDSVLDCKLVCKPWRNLIKNPSFARMHLARHKLMLQKLDEDNIQDLSTYACDTAQLGCLFLQRIDKKSHDSRLHYVECNIDTKKKAYEVKCKTINIPPINNFDRDVSLVNSCNGLICSTMRHHRLNDPIHICNPVTREYVYLPIYTSEEEIDTYWMKSGFGYIPSTDEYKVVRIFYNKVFLSEGRWYFQVYTLGNESNKWTEEKEIPHPLFQNVSRYSNGVLVNGEIHWLDNASKIVAFNLADEEFRYVPSPPLVEGSTGGKSLSVLGNWLCFVHRKSATMERSNHVDIWLLKMNKSVNVQQNETYNWNKEFTVQAETSIDLIPLAFTTKGKVLFWQDHKFLYCYDPNTPVLEKLSKDKDDYEGALESYKETRHINSFISLKSLGVKNCRRRLQYKGK